MSRTGWVVISAVALIPGLLVWVWVHTYPNVADLAFAWGAVVFLVVFLVLLGITSLVRRMRGAKA